MNEHKATDITQDVQDPTGYRVDKDWYIAERIVAKRNDMVFWLDQLVHAGQNGFIVMKMQGYSLDYVKIESGPSFGDIGVSTQDVSAALSIPWANHVGLPYIDMYTSRIIVDTRLHEIMVQSNEYDVVDKVQKDVCYGGWMCFVQLSDARNDT